MFLHIDGDIIVYRAGFAAEKQQWVVYDGDGVPQGVAYKKSDAEALLGDAEGYVEKGDRVAEPLRNAIWAAKMIMGGIERRFEDRTGVRVYLSGDENFREDIAETRVYKGNRDPANKPVHAAQIKRWLEKKYDVSYSVAEEADDEIGYNHYAMWKEDEYSTCIVTLDKDLDMIPGVHFNFVKDELYTVDAMEAERFFWKQMLTGDPVDNIEGVPGIGSARADKILADMTTPSEWRQAVKQVYKDAFKAEWRARMMEFGQLLWIRRQRDQMFTIPKELEE